MKGLVDEHRALHEEDPSPEMLELANLSGAEKTEHYEMVMYTGLVQMAKDLGEPESAQLLQENLDQEQAMAKRVAALAKAIAKQAKAARTGDGPGPGRLITTRAGRRRAPTREAAGGRRMTEQVEKEDANHVPGLRMRRTERAPRRRAPHRPGRRAGRGGGLGDFDG